MKLFILFFLFIVVTCQAHQSPLRRRQIARQGDPEADDPALNEQIYEKFENLARKYMNLLDPDLQRLLVPEIYKVDHLRTRDSYKNPPGPLANTQVYNPTMSQQYSNPTPSRFNNPALQTQNSFTPSRFTHPAVHTSSLINQSTQLRQDDQMEEPEADRKARLAQVDKEALSQLYEDDKKLIESTLTLSEREALLAQLEDGKLDDLLSREENRFGDMQGTGALSAVAAELGSTAGSYIGSKLAGTLGGKLGAAAGAYLGAAAASKFVKKAQAYSDNGDNVKTEVKKEFHYDTNGFGAVKV